MKTFAALAVPAALMLGAPGAAAQDSTYFGANYAIATYKETGVESANPTALSLRLGKEISRNFAIEGRFGFGIGDDSVVVLGIPVTVEVEQFFGFYGRGILPLSEMFSIYGLFGFTNGEITASALGVSISESDSDISYGVGADLLFSKNAGINFEWAKLLEGTGYKVEAISIGFLYKF